MSLTPLPGGGFAYPADENPLGLQAFAPSQAGTRPTGYDSGNTAGSGLPTGSANAASSQSEFWQGVESLTNAFNPASSLGESVGQAIGGNLSGIAKTASGIGSAFEFITDIPRVTTTLVGLILIIVGLAALIRQPITINTVRTAAEATL